MAEGGAAKEPIAKQIRDWLFFAFALLGMFMGLYNFFVNLADRRNLDKLEEVSVAQKISKKLAEITRERGRDRELSLLGIQTEIDQSLEPHPRSTQLKRLKAEALFLSGQRPRAIGY